MRRPECRSCATDPRRTGARTWAWWVRRLPQWLRSLVFSISELELLCLRDTFAAVLLDGDHRGPWRPWSRPCESLVGSLVGDSGPPRGACRGQWMSGSTFVPELVELEGRSEVKGDVPQLPSGRHVHLREDLAQMPFDGAGADEQLCPDLAVRLSVPGQPGDLRLLCGEVVARADCRLRTSRPSRAALVRARSANAAGPMAVSWSWAVRRWSRASTRGPRAEAIRRTGGATLASSTAGRVRAEVFDRLRDRYERTRPAEQSPHARLEAGAPITRYGGGAFGQPG